MGGVQNKLEKLRALVDEINRNASEPDWGVVPKKIADEMGIDEEKYTVEPWGERYVIFRKKEKDDDVGVAGDE